MIDLFRDSLWQFVLGILALIVTVWIAYRQSVKKRNDVFYDDKHTDSFEGGKVFNFSRYPAYIGEMPYIVVKSGILGAIYVLNGMDAHKCYILGAGKYTFTVGRSNRNNIPISSVFISRYHAMFSVNSDTNTIKVKDISRNGLVVNNKSILEKELSNKDVITICDISVQIYLFNVPKDIENQPSEIIFVDPDTSTIEIPLPVTEEPSPSPRSPKKSFQKKRDDIG